jgi:two-component system, NarL family, nitrate/nitrite response regulator NarL
VSQSLDALPESQPERVAGTGPPREHACPVASADPLFEAIKSGAHGYLLKTVEPEGLCALLRGVFRGEAPLSRATAAKILKQFAKREAAAPAMVAGDDLTAREREVLEHLVSGLTNKEIGSRLAIAESTVKNHLKSILAKLHLDNRVQAAALAIRQGLVRDRKADREPSG